MHILYKNLIFKNTCIKYLLHAKYWVSPVPATRRYKRCIHKLYNEINFNVQLREPQCTRMIQQEAISSIWRVKEWSNKEGTLSWALKHTKIAISSSGEIQYHKWELNKSHERVWSQMSDQIWLEGKGKIRKGRRWTLKQKWGSTIEALEYHSTKYRLYSLGNGNQ